LLTEKHGESEARLLMVGFWKKSIFSVMVAIEAGLLVAVCRVANMPQPF
jgi:hypothetical protein